MSTDALSLEAKNDSWAHYYGGARPSWRLFRGNAASHLPLIRRILWPLPTRALEVGTGTATMSALISMLPVRVTSIDIERQILHAGKGAMRHFHARARFAQADAFQLPFPSGAFDVAFSQGFFEHFADGQIGALLREQARVAKRVVFSVPNLAYGNHDFGNERLMTRGEWDGVIREAGLRLVESLDYCPLRPRVWQRLPIYYLAVVTA